MMIALHLIEVYGSIDCKDIKPDDCNAIDQLRVGTMIQSDVGQKDATKETTADDLESRCGNTVEGICTSALIL